MVPTKTAGSFLTFYASILSFAFFLDLKSHHTAIAKKTTVYVYHHGKQVFSRQLFTPFANPPVVLVPLFHFIYFFNIVYALYVVRRELKLNPQLFITSFSVWALGGCFARALGLVSKVILWSWDYYPLYKDNPYYYIQLLLEPFEKLGIRCADYAWYASQSNFEIRCATGQITNPQHRKHRVVHWGTGGTLTAPRSANYSQTGILRLLYFGAIHYEKGISLVVDALDELIKVTNGKLEVLLIGGDSPFKETLKTQVNQHGHAQYVKFLDFMPQEELATLASSVDLGLALFVPEIGGKVNFSHYADPAKPRDYLANGLPMLITKVPFIHQDVEHYNAGIVLDTFTVAELVLAVNKYMAHPEKYFKGAYELSQVDRYDTYYAAQFESLKY